MPAIRTASSHDVTYLLLWAAAVAASSFGSPSVVRRCLRREIDRVDCNSSSCSGVYGKKMRASQCWYCSRKQPSQRASLATPPHPRLIFFFLYSLYYFLAYPNNGAWPTRAWLSPALRLREFVVIISIHPVTFLFTECIAECGADVASTTKLHKLIHLSN